MVTIVDTLSAQPMLVAASIAGAVAGVTLERVRTSIVMGRRKAFWAGRNWHKKRQGSAAKVVSAKPADLAADQLRRVMLADFKARPLLNKPERRLLESIDRILTEDRPDWRAMAQVSLGEILSSPDKDAFWAINSKRVDLLIIDRDYRPLHAIEFQGEGHHTGKETAARDAIKKEALRRAGIGYVEVVSGDRPSQLRAIIRRLSGHSAGIAETSNGGLQPQR